MTWGLWGYGVPGPGERTAMPHDEDDYDELYHFTDDPHFSGPHPDHEPATISEFSEPGIYLTNNPHNSSVTGGKRPYMATFRVPSWYQDHPGFESDHYGNSSDYFVRPEWFHELKFQGITPTSGSSRHAHRTAMPWYHASPHDLAPGTILTPGGGGHNYDYDNWAPGEGRQDHVWVTDDPDNAEGWAGVAAWDSPHKRGHVYEVEPEDPQEWDGEGGADEGHITPSARIVRKIKTIDHGTHTASRIAMPAPLLESINPTGGLFFDYDPESRTGQHGPHVTTLDKAMMVHPDHPVTIYRGAPRLQKDISPGDFITTDQQLAQMYAGEGHVLQKQVPARHVATDPDEWEGGEHIYSPQHHKESRIMTAAVTVYTQPSCIQCTMTKKQLDKLGIEHDTVDVSTDPDAHAYVTGLGYTSAPVVVIGDGEDHWAGFKPDRLRGLAE